jgi:uncharacterized protein YwgA
MSTEKNPKKRDKELEELIQMANSLDLDELLHEIKLKESDTFPELEDLNEELSSDAYFIDVEDIEVERKPVTSLSLESKDGLKTVLKFLKGLSKSSEGDEAIKIIKNIIEEQGVD